MDSFLITNSIEEDQSKEYSTWIESNEKFIPELNIKIHTSLPSGIYKASFDNAMYKYIVTELKDTSDEIIYFEDTHLNDILNELNIFWQSEDLYKKHNITHKRGVLFQGNPGTGKTMLTNAIKKDIINNNGLVFIVDSVQTMSCTTHVLKNIVRKIEPDRPIVTIIEDIDQMIVAAGNNDNFILDFLDGQNTINHHLVILTSNNTESLSEALLRPSRIDLKYEIGNPTLEMRKIYLEKKNYPKDLLEKTLELTNDYSFAKLKEVFISVIVLKKDLEVVIEQINNPLLSKDYLTNNNQIGI